jgi:hypothetical protein
MVDWGFEHQGCAGCGGSMVYRAPGDFDEIKGGGAYGGA